MREQKLNNTIKDSAAGTKCSITCEVVCSAPASPGRRRRRPCTRTPRCRGGSCGTAARPGCRESTTARIQTCLLPDAGSLDNFHNGDVLSSRKGIAPMSFTQVRTSEHRQAVVSRYVHGRIAHHTKPGKTWQPCSGTRPWRPEASWSGEQYLPQHGALHRCDEALLLGVIAVHCPLQPFVEPADDG